MAHNPEHLDGLAYSQELVDRVNAEAADATWWWFPYAAVAVVVLAIAASAVWPWGFAA